MLTYNDPKLKDRRKELRRRETPEEKMLWSKLRSNSLGHKFFRQYSVGAYILDFYCSEKRLAIELDGLIHLKNKEYDKERDNYMAGQDILVLRFQNKQLNDSMDSILEEIRRSLSSS